MSERRQVVHTWFVHTLNVSGRCGACGDIEFGGTKVWSLDPQIPKNWVCDFCMNRVIDPGEVSC